MPFRLDSPVTIALPFFLALLPQAPLGAKAQDRFLAPPVENDAAMIAKINSAIERGERYLLESQGKHGSWQNEERGARIGYTELALYALASTAEELAPPATPEAKPAKPRGAKPAPPPRGAEIAAAIERGIGYVKENPYPQTYALSLLLLALDAKSSPRWERTRLAAMPADQRVRYSYPRKLTNAEELWIEETTAELLQHRFKGLWSYEKNPGVGDVSNTQFALLGLRAANRCGAVIEPAVWHETLEYFLKYQDDDGPEVAFDIPKPPPPGASSKLLEVVGVRAQARSWGYSFAKGGGSPSGKLAKPGRMDRVPVAGFTFGASGTHTSIGIASLQIARDELSRALNKKNVASIRDAFRASSARIDAGIRDGLGWLAAHWNLETDPGGGFPFYYLYSIERVGALLGERWIAGHDWYREGAEILLRRQLGNGAWPSDLGESVAMGAPDVVTTSFALLFLRKATMPGVITPSIR